MQLQNHPDLPVVGADTWLCGGITFESGVEACVEACRWLEGSERSNVARCVMTAYQSQVHSWTFI